jgi:hypothetical protein
MISASLSVPNMQLLYIRAFCLTPQLTTFAPHRRTLSLQRRLYSLPLIPEGTIACGDGLGCDGLRGDGMLLVVLSQQLRRGLSDAPNVCT